MNIIGKDGKLLHKVIYQADIKNGRVDHSDDKEFLQVATLKHDKGKTFNAHRHIWNFDKQERVYITQECWVIISGKVKVTYYDTDGTMLNELYLWPGDLTITYEGGHNYMFMEDNSHVIEIKTGPYYGQEHDKTFI